MTPRPPARIVELLIALAGHDVRFVVIGAVAGQVHGLVRPTDDLDVVPERTRANYERLATCLLDLGAELRIGDGSATTTFPIDVDYLLGVSTWTLATRLGDLDVLAEPAPERRFEQLNESALKVDLGDGVVVAFASREEVILLKQFAARPTDLADIDALRRAGEIADEAR